MYYCGNSKASVFQFAKKQCFLGEPSVAFKYASAPPLVGVNIASNRVSSALQAGGSPTETLWGVDSKPRYTFRLLK